MSSSVLDRQIAEPCPGVGPQASAQAAASPRFPRSAGLLCCISGALSYTAANFCQRSVVGVCHPLWVTWVRAAVPAVVLAFWLLREHRRGQRVWPAPRLAAMLLANSLLTQWGGNLMFQQALEMIGMSVTVPIVFGFPLVASAALGWLLLGERVSPRAAAAIVAVILSLVSLSAGACSSSGGSVSWADRGWLVAATGIGVALAAGGSFAVSTVVMRRALAAGMAPCTVVFLVTATGLVTLGSWGFWRLGGGDLLAAGPGNLALMFFGGVCNLIGFVAFTTGLSLTNVVSANTLNASQVAASAVLGVLLFAEPAHPLLVFGAALNIAGMLCIGSPRAADTSGG